jgi:hypothetical protein
MLTSARQNTSSLLALQSGKSDDGKALGVKGGINIIVDGKFSVGSPIRDLVDNSVYCMGVIADFDPKNRIIESY